MFDAILTPEQKALRDEVHPFVDLSPYGLD
jgi:hypothetical protein